MGEMAYGWAKIDKAERQPDGSVLVTGLVSDAGIDRDGQGMNQEWLDATAKRWFDESGNIREQHDRFKAAGVGVNMVRKSDGGWVLQSRIVDPVAAMKCLPGPNGERPVYQGYSIGIREPRLSFEKAEFPGGEVVGGYWCEVSLADRPSNPRTLFSMVKTDGDGNLIPGDGERWGAVADVDKVEDADLTKDWKAFDEARKLGHEPSVRLGDQVRATHEGKAVEGKVTGFQFQPGKRSEGAGHYVDVAHSGGSARVARDSITHVKQAPAPVHPTIGAKVGATHDDREITGHVVGVDDQHVHVAHGGQITKVPHEAVHTVQPNFASPAKPHVGDPGKPVSNPTYSESQHLNTSGGAAAALAPEKRDEARRQAEHEETQRIGRQAMGEGQFEAAIRQATAANARRLAGAGATKAEAPDLLKFVSAKQRTKYAKSGIAMPNGDFPIADTDHLHAAIGLLGNYGGDKAAAKAHILKRAAALGVNVDLDGDGDNDADGMSKVDAAALLLKAAGWLISDMINPTDLTKADTPEEIEGMDKAEVAAMITAAVTDGLKGLEQRWGEQIAALAGRVEKVEASPVPGGPAATRSPGQTQLAQKTEVKRVQDEISEFDAAADLYKSEDPILAQGYRELADQRRALLVRP